MPKKQRADARSVVESVLSKPLPVIDMEQLSRQQQIEYAKEAQTVLSSPAFVQEVNTILDECTKEIVYRAQDMEKVLDMRMTINGIKLLIERLEERAENVRTTEVKSIDPYAGI